MPKLICLDCKHEWKALFHVPGRKIKCPKCGSEKIAVSPKMW